MMIDIEGHTIIVAFGGVASALLSIWSLTSKGRDSWGSWWERRQKKKQMPELICCIKKELGIILKRQKVISERQKGFEKELTTNGGSSLKDEVRLLVSERMMELQEAPYPAFRTNTNGENIFVNRAYETLVAANDDALIGLGWRQFSANTRESDSYFRRWKEISATKSHFAGTLSFKNTSGQYRGQWFVRIVPLGPNKTHDQVWGGRLHPEDDVAKKISEGYGWDRS